MQEVFEKIINELKQESIIVDDDAGNRAVEIIEQVATEYNNGWIPCSKWLPEDGEEVLATDGVYRYLVKYDGDLDAPFGDLDKIVAWQPSPPLPEPYKLKVKEPKKQTNADRIRFMNDEELADFLMDVAMGSLFEKKIMNVKDWLQSEVEG